MSARLFCIYWPHNFLLQRWSSLLHQTYQSQTLKSIFNFISANKTEGFFFVQKNEKREDKAK
jgi:hypothetical protein